MVPNETGYLDYRINFIRINTQCYLNLHALYFDKYQ